MKTHIALISLYSTDAIGLRYLKSVLKSRGFDVSVILFKELYLSADLMSLPNEKEHQLLIKLLSELKPDLVGISLRSSYFKIASHITQKIRQELSLPVIWGGTHPTIAPDECIQVADIICIGEGEYPLLELAERISAGQNYADVKNLWLRKGGQVIKNDVRALISDLNVLPFPHYGDQDMYFVENDEVSAGDPGPLI
jgi:radical SAM superfamily enzyme YgiQ (UPF0313 family)